jgi:hypothetical protein
MRIVLNLLVLPFVAFPGAIGAAPWEPKDATARKYLDEGRVAFKAGDYRRAGALFGQSYDAEANLNARWNAAQSFAAAGDWKRATRLYDELLADRELPAERRGDVEKRQRLAALFLSADFAAEAKKWDDARAILLKLVNDRSLGDNDHKVAVARLDELTKAQAAAEVAAKLPDPGPSDGTSVRPPPPPRRPSRFDDRIALGLIGAGVVGLGVGGGFLWNASQLEDDAANATIDREAQDLYDRADSWRTIGQIALGVGGAVLIGGVVKFWLVPEASSASVANVQPLDGGAMLVFGGALE